jgi:hypothetical protein
MNKIHLIAKKVNKKGMNPPNNGNGNDNHNNSGITTSNNGRIINPNYFKISI